MEDTEVLKYSMERERAKVKMCGWGRRCTIAQNILVFASKVADIRLILY